MARNSILNLSLSNIELNTEQSNRSMVKGRQLDLPQEKFQRTIYIQLINEVVGCGTWPST